MCSEGSNPSLTTKPTPPSRCTGGNDEDENHTVSGQVWERNPMSWNRKATDQQIIQAYKECGSCKKAARKVGICYQSVHQRLKRLGVPMPYKHKRFTQTELDRLRRDYVRYRDWGRLDELAAEMDRPKTSICLKARRLGLTTYRRPQRQAGKWKYMTEKEARVIFEKFRETKRLTIEQFAKREGFGYVGFNQTMMRFFPDEWDVVIESRQPRQTMYRLGRGFEYRVRDYLRKNGYYVLRSPQSAGPADLVALRPSEVLMIQCKRNGWPGLPEALKFWELAESCGAVPCLANMPGPRGVALWRIAEKPDHKGYKREPFEVTQ